MKRRLLFVLPAIVVLTVVVTVIIARWTLWHELSNPEIQLQVERGATARQVLSQLSDHGLLPSRLAGRVYLMLFSEGRSFHHGHYLIPPKSRPVDVLERILNGAVETVTVRVVEGLSAHETAQVYITAGFGSEEQWETTILSREYVQDIAPEAPSLEGFLFPDTYQFAVGVSPDTIARHMVNRFRALWLDVMSSAPLAWGTAFQTVTLASMVEAETSRSSERARVAGVFFNRLQRGMLLQCDPTVVYALKRNGSWQGRLLRKHWLFDDPYNTYLYQGLPPSPINSPGEASIVAAIDPEAHSYLYFVASPQGGHTFSQNLADHNRAVAALRASRR